MCVLSLVPLPHLMNYNNNKKIQMKSFLLSKWRWRGIWGRKEGGGGGEETEEDASYYVGK